MSFAIFWAQYPIKKGKVAAEKAWGKLEVTDALLQAILKALEAQKKEKQELARAKQFVPAWPHAATYLNGRRWEDEITVIEQPKDTKKNPPKPSYHELWVKPDWMK